MQRNHHTYITHVCKRDPINTHRRLRRQFHRRSLLRDCKNSRVSHIDRPHRRHRRCCRRQARSVITSPYPRGNPVLIINNTCAQKVGERVVVAQASETGYCCAATRKRYFCKNRCTRVEKEGEKDGFGKHRAVRQDKTKFHSKQESWICREYKIDNFSLRHSTRVSCVSSRSKIVSKINLDIFVSENHDLD